MKLNDLKFEEIKNKLAADAFPIFREQGYRYFSVFVPLMEIDGEAHILFEVRSPNLASQPNEVCFPGGKIEPDETPLDAAVRETNEELGCPESTIQVLSALPLLVTPFGAILHGFLGHLRCYPEHYNKDEVHEVFTVPVSFFLNNEPEKHDILVTTTPDENFPFHWIENGTSYRWGKGKYTVLFYRYQGRVIWGMTAKLVNSLLPFLRD